MSVKQYTITFKQKKFNIISYLLKLIFFLKVLHFTVSLKIKD